MTVHVVTPVNPEIAAPARQYGDLLFVNDRFVYGDEIDDECLPVTFQHNMWEAARKFQPDQDYLLIGGDHLQLVAYVTILARLYKEFRVLRWDRKAQGYLTVQIQGHGANQRDAAIKALSDLVGFDVNNDAARPK